MIVELSSERFEEVYDIMLVSFPDCELRTKQGQRQLWENPCYHVKAYEEAGQILAFLTYWELPDCRFIEHLATTPACRGRGIGAELVKECTNGMQRPVFLEIEPITNQDPMTGRRAKFYERLGFSINTFPYEQIPLKEGDAKVSLWVMSYGSFIGEDNFLPYKAQIYKIAYGANGNV